MCLIHFTLMGSKFEMMDKYLYQNFDSNKGLQSDQIATIAGSFGRGSGAVWPMVLF